MLLVMLAVQLVAAPIRGTKNALTQGGARVVQNPYIRLSVDSEQRVSVRFDASGKGRYKPGQTMIGAYGMTSNGRAEIKPGGVRINGSRYCIPGAAKGGYPGPWDHGEDLPVGGSLGQRFTVPAGGGWLSDVWAQLTCSGVDNSSVRMVLRKDGPAGQIVASRLVKPLPEQAMVRIGLSKPLPPGAYYLEVGEKSGGAYWWGCNTDTYQGGMAYVSGKAQPGKDWVFGYDLADVGTLDWELRLHGNELLCSYNLRQHTIKTFTPALALSFPWTRDGYDTTNLATTPFRYLTTDSGFWFPVEAFKRNESDWNLLRESKWARLRGTGGYDLKISHSRTGLETHMEPDRMHMLLGPKSRLQVLPNSDVLPDTYPRFFTSDKKTSDVMDRFMKTFLFWNTSCPSTYEFDALKLSWIGGPEHTGFRNVVQFYTNRCDPDGYIWSRPDSRGWNGDSPTNDNRHYDNNCPFILACWDIFSWTGDKAYLNATIATVRKATDYLLDVQDGRSGVLTIHSPQHTGITVPQGFTNPSSYFDCIPTGYRDAYINAFYAPALHASAELERAAGNTARADELDRLVVVAKQQFNKTFWDDAKGRYISWVDSSGAKHDWGMTYVNTIAATYGLADQQQVKRMYDWMENQPTSSGAADTFTRWVFAPRSNTIACTEQANRLKYDEWCEDGGAILWTAFYELMSRAKYLGADNSWRRFKQILARYDMPDKLCGGNPMYRGEIDNRGDGPYGPGSVGVWGEFPESGLAPCAFLYGVVGLRVDIDGLHIRPNLPSELKYAGVENLVFRGVRMKVTSYRTHVTVEWAGHRIDKPLPASGEITFTEDVFKPRWCGCLASVDMKQQWGIVSLQSA